MENRRSNNFIWKGIIEQYKQFFSVGEKTPIITLLEGNTPLIKASNLNKRLNLDLDIYLKFDGTNPTGSFKDRGMTLAISKAVEENSKAVICASTGNTSASAAAYSARAGIKCIVVIPEGNIALGKLAQAIVHGATVLQIQGNFDQALQIVKEVANKYPITLVNSINPFRIEGQKSAAFEICDYFGDSPQYHVLPVGNAGNITAYWKGFKEYQSYGLIKNLPIMLGFQASEASPIVKGYPIEKPETIATAIRIGNPASWASAIAARDESKGVINDVTDEEILSAYKLIASSEGIFCEPASAASIAGVIKLYKQGFFQKGSTIVCTLTGSGLKDPDVVFKVSNETILVKAQFESIRAIIEKIL